MRRALPLLVLALLGPANVHAQGINLYWNDCSGGTTQSIDATFACDTNTGAAFTAIVSAFPPVEMPQFVGVEYVVDALVNAATPPPWWQVDLGQCRAGALTATSDPTAMGAVSCPDIWHGEPPTSIYDITTTIVPNGFRIRGAAAIAQPSAITVADVGQEFVVGAVRISRAKTTGADACAGCLTGACFALNQVRLVDSSGANTVYLQSPRDNNWVQYNGGTGNYNCYVPAVNRTWGAIKTLYR